ncbi:hypothetical protein HYT26_03780 [Candidatus Pacearchaeota archaeon]|nr:hypothetical protein [Candidatus Pacearchaeota archaeon]
MPIYIIEHLEPRLSKWCLIEYKHISEIVGKRNLWFSNIKLKKDREKLKRYGRVIKESVSKLNLKNACILDPDARKTLAPKEARKFRYFIFGGILGDYPAKKRTKDKLTKFVKNAAARNIGKKQFSTDNAIYVAKQIASGKNFSNLKFKDKIEIQKNKVESFILPYRYALHEGKPLASKELVRYLKRKRTF